MARNSDARTRKTSVSLPSEQEMAIRRNHESRFDPNIARRSASGRGGYQMSADDAIAAASLMDRTRVISPFAGLPTAASVGEFRGTTDPYEQEKLARQELAKIYKLTDDDSFWGQDYDEDQSGYDYNNLAQPTLDPSTGRVRGGAVTKGRGRQPAPISVVPTSTTNPDRPRTVAAGYDESRRVLTVVFRDGTFYNYYDVEPEIWQQFKALPSKGQFIIPKVLDNYPRGTANMASASLAAREGLYRIARTGQWVNDGQVSAQYDRSLAPRLNPTKSRSRKK